MLLKLYRDILNLTYVFSISYICSTVLRLSAIILDTVSSCNPRKIPSIFTSFGNFFDSFIKNWLFRISEIGKTIQDRFKRHCKINRFWLPCFLTEDKHWFQYSNRLKILSVLYISTYLQKYLKFELIQVTLLTKLGEDHHWTLSL